MKKSQKTELTKERIIDAAISEFGEKGYEGSTINNICNNSCISKGLIYHNYENKDDIYMHCVEYTLNAFVDFMKAQEIKDDMQKYMDLRYRFFNENNLLRRVFFEAVLQPPKHLELRIKELKKYLDDMNLSIYRAALKKVTLRKGVTEQEALDYYSIMQEMFNGYFNSSAYSDIAFSTLISHHESKLAKMFDFMLYGIAEEGDIK